MMTALKISVYQAGEGRSDFILPLSLANAWDRAFPNAKFEILAEKAAGDAAVSLYRCLNTLEGHPGRFLAHNESRRDLKELQDTLKAVQQSAKSNPKAAFLVQILEDASGLRAQFKSLFSDIRKNGEKLAREAGIDIEDASAETLKLLIAASSKISDLEEEALEARLGDDL